MMPKIARAMRIAREYAGGGEVKTHSINPMNDVTDPDVHPMGSAAGGPRASLHMAAKGIPTRPKTRKQDLGAGDESKVYDKGDSAEEEGPAPSAPLGGIARYKQALQRGEITPAEYEGFMQAMPTPSANPPGFPDKATARIELGRSSRLIDQYDPQAPLGEKERTKLLDAFRRKQAAQQYLTSTQPIDSGDEDAAPPISYASGGGTGNFNPERASAIGLTRQGMINSSVPGRTDKLNLNVPNGSYIIPADIPSALGQGNSMAGSAILNKMFNSGPYGMNLSKGSRVAPRHSSLSFSSKAHFAKGGQTGSVAPIVAAGGEYVIHPETVAQLGNGDINLGHDILDQFVKQVREKHISTLKSLKPPKGSKK